MTARVPMPDVERLEKVMAELSKTLDNRNPYADPRKQKQLGIEQAIVDFRPDAIEAQEILCAIRAALGNRYTEGQLTDVETQAIELNEALTELWETT